MNVNLLEKRSIDKDGEITLDYLVSPKFNAKCPIRDTGKIDAQRRRRQCKHKVRDERYSYKTRKRKRRGMEPLLESLKGIRPCQHYDFRFLTPRIARE